VKEKKTFGHPLGMQRRAFRAAGIFLALATALFVAATAFAACASLGASPKPAEASFTLIETTDVHGDFFPYDFKTGKDKPTSLSQVSAIVKEKRAMGDVLLVDDGDILQGQPVIYYYNFMKTDVPNPVSQIYNYMGYDAIAVGNHDVETGHAVYDKVNKEFTGAKFMSANIVKKSDGKPWFQPYKIVKKDGLRIAILALTEPGFVKNFPSILYDGCEVEDMVVSAAKWMKVIQEKEKPDMVIGLFHSGVDYTYGGQKAETPSNENAAQLVAQKVDGFDLVLVGHDHQGWEGMGWDPVSKARVDILSPSGKTVPIWGGQNDLRKIPVLSVTATLGEDGDYDVAVSGELVDPTGVTPDPEFLSKFASYAEGAKEWLSTKIGSMKGTINSRDSMYGDSAFVDLIHDLQLAVTRDPANNLKPAQISFCAPLSANAVLPSRADGSVTVADMFTLYMYENWLYTMDLTGAQIKGFLEDSYGNWMAQMKGDQDHLIAFSFDADGKMVTDPRTNLPRSKTASYNYDSAQGINYTVDVTKSAGSRITITSLSDGTPFDPAKTYTVAINSYRAMGGGGLLERGAGISAADLLSMKYVTSATDRDLRYYLTAWFEKNASSPVSPTADGNWKVIPESLAAAGAKTDRALMYP